MKNSIFDKNYSYIYDLIYKDKKYSSEVARILNFLKNININKNSQFIDLGCGTGNHLIELLKLGYNVDGFDISDEMLKFAREKLNNHGFFNTKLYQGDIMNMKLDKRFDVLLCLFNVIGYLEDLNLTIKKIIDHSKEKSIFIFDFWSSELVKKYKPKKTISVKKYENSLITKESQGKLLSDNKLEIKIKFSVKQNDKIIIQNTETHYVNSYNLKKLKETLVKKGFKKIFFEDFSDLKPSIKNKNWNMLCYAVK